jgi:hypothetical protein
MVVVVEVMEVMEVKRREASLGRPTCKGGLLADERE